MSDPDNLLKSIEEQYGETLGLLKGLRETFFNAYEQENKTSTDPTPSFPIKMPDVVWEAIKDRIPDVPINKRGRPSASKRLIAEAVLTTVYLQETPDIFLGNEIISASTVWKYRRLWEKKGVFKKIKSAKIPHLYPPGQINWRWIKKIDLFLR